MLLFETTIAPNAEKPRADCRSQERTTDAAPRPFDVHSRLAEMRLRTERRCTGIESIHAGPTVMHPRIHLPNVCAPPLYLSISDGEIVAKSMDLPSR